MLLFAGDNICVRICQSALKDTLYQMIYMAPTCIKSSVLDSDVIENNCHGLAFKKLRPSVTDDGVNYIHFESKLCCAP